MWWQSRGAQETFIIIINVENCFCCLIFLWKFIFLVFQYWKTIEYKVQKIDLKLIEDDNLIISVPFNLKYFLMNRKFKDQHLFKIYILFINVFVPSVFNHLIGP